MSKHSAKIKEVVGKLGEAAGPMSGTMSQEDILDAADRLFTDSLSKFEMLKKRLEKVEPDDDDGDEISSEQLKDMKVATNKIIKALIMVV
jgi:hypothetical protein